MANTSLTPELAKLAGELAAAFAGSQKVVAAKARIGLFYQNPEATDLFRKVSEYGETLRNKHMEGMPPSEEELSKFDQLRSAVVENELCKGFLESRQMLDDMLSVVNQYLCLAIEKGSAPSDEEVAESMNQQMSACSCGGGCHGDCGDCDNESCGKKCDCGDSKCNCGPDCTCGCQEGKECTCGEGECCGKHGEGHECKCGKH
ncbi:MAG: YlbF family regulator [Akkermansia sp.]|nr:YlbF family regulator [Akkermansia sp.]